MQAVWDKTNENVGLVNLTITTALELNRYWFQKLFYICVQIWEKLLSYVTETRRIRCQCYNGNLVSKKAKLVLNSIIEHLLSVINF